MHQKKTTLDESGVFPQAVLDATSTSCERIRSPLWCSLVASEDQEGCEPLPQISASFLRIKYDYSGYGQSTGKPSECNTYADINAVYKCLKEKYEVRDEQIILYGQSVGNGPTFDLASHSPNLRGVVLHSPILSGLRVLYPVKRTYWFDIYKNIDKIGMVNCPVLLYMLLCAVVVIAANAGGSWTPIGDVTTAMLWIHGEISTLRTMKVFLYLQNIFLEFVCKGYAGILSSLVYFAESCTY